MQIKTKDEIVRQIIRLEKEFRNCIGPISSDDDRPMPVSAATRRIIKETSEFLVTGGVRVLINCCTQGMGHLAFEPAWYMTSQQLKGEPLQDKPVILTLNDGQVSNNYLLRLWERFFIVFRSIHTNRLIQAAALEAGVALDIGGVPFPPLPQGKEFTLERNRRYVRMMKDITAYKNSIGKAILAPPEELAVAGSRELQKLGVNAKDWFVCLHASEVSINGRYAYDPFRRNRISDFAGAIRRIAERGGKVIRMGDTDLPPAPRELPLIDYPLSPARSDWMDIFLISNCRYFFGSQSGPHVVASIFGKPKVLANMVPWQMINSYAGDIYMPKLIKDRRTGSFIAVEEYIDNGLDFAQWGLPDRFEVYPNSDDDLVSAVDEMECYLNSGWPQRLGPLQHRWARMLPSDSQCALAEGRIADSFVNKHARILFGRKGGNVKKVQKESSFDGQNMVFILGSPRSGTTWVQRLLAAHPAVRTGQESDIFDMFVGPQIKAWQTSINWELSGRPVGLSAYLKADEFFKILSNYMLALLEPMIGDLGTGEIFIEKTPSHALFIPEIMQMLPRCRIVHVLRDPRDVVASLLAAGRSWGKNWAPDNAVAASDMWVRHVQAARKAARQLPESRYREIRYEELSKYTKPILSDLYDFLDLKWTDTQVSRAIEQNRFKIAKKTCGTQIRIQGELAEELGPVPVEPEGFVRKGRVGSWKEDLSADDLADIRRIAGSTSADVGYSWTHPDALKNAANVMPGIRAELQMFQGMQSELNIDAPTLKRTAIQLLEILKKRPGDTNALTLLSRLEAANGHWEEALEIIKDILILEPYCHQALQLKRYIESSRVKPLV